MKKYGVIYADPPWSFSNRPFKRSKNGQKIYAKITDHYQVMNHTDIENLDINSISNDDCVLFMWTTDAHLEFAMGVIKAWGFKYKTVGFVWSKKTSSGKQAQILGPYGMKNCEICLLATKGKGHSLIEARNVTQLIESQRGKHSQKPEEARNRINKMFSKQNKIELFAREKSKGWDIWGNELSNDVIL